MWDVMLENDVSGLLNLSRDDIERIISQNGAVPGSNESTINTDTEPENNWLFAINTLSGIGVLANSLLVIAIVVDFVLNKAHLGLTSHWLLLNMSLTIVAYLGLGIYLRIYGEAMQLRDKTCLVLQHTDKTMEAVIVMYLVALAMHILGRVIRPKSKCSKRNTAFWIIFILFIMVCANLGILALYTMNLDQNHNPNIVNCHVYLSHILLTRYVHVTSIATFYVPYGIVLVLAVTTLICAFIQQKRAHRGITTVNSATKFATVFLFITATVGFLLMLPSYLLQIPEILSIFIWGLQIRLTSCLFLTTSLKMLFFIVFPFLCLLLKEIRRILPALVKR